ncbi:MAG: ribonuclease III [Bacteroidetes bacterium]|nr:ribonuclease III [Bacteroidota bacterium]
MKILKKLKKIIGLDKNKPNQKINDFLANVLDIKPKDYILYEIALIHSSYDPQIGNNNERLEFLGDSILQTIISHIIFELYPNKKEGELTKIRSEIVSRKIIGKIANNMNISNIIKYNKSVQKDKLRYVEGNALEALIGAIFIDYGYQKCKNIIYNKIITPYVNFGNLEFNYNSAKSKLLEWGQRNKKNVDFSVLSEIGQGHSKEFEIIVKVDNKKLGKGRGFNKRSAEQYAASDALEKLKINK